MNTLLNVAEFPERHTFHLALTTKTLQPLITDLSGTYIQQIQPALNNNYFLKIIIPGN